MAVDDNNPGSSYRDPIANAGMDQLIHLPTDSVFVDGRTSYGPDFKIVKYVWSKVGGPSSYNINKPENVTTWINSLTIGVYLFELKVYDNKNNFSADTVQIKVEAATTNIICGNRPMINITLSPIGNLSEARIGLSCGTTNNKILFAGGMVPYSHYSSRVDIFDISANTWSTAELTIPERQGMAVASVGNKILFAGGGDNDWGITTSRVDIFDASNNSWSTAELSKKREFLTATTLGNKIFFAGGGDWEPNLVGSNRVDIYNNSTNTWSTASMAWGRMDHSATAVGNKIYFAGGTSGYYTSLNVLNSIDIYDEMTNSWSTSFFQGDARMIHAAIAADNKIFWASGIKYAALGSGFIESNNVEIKNLTTGTSTFACIDPRTRFEAVIKDNNIVFFTGNSNSSEIDIYNTTSGTWSIGILPVAISAATIISVNNTIYVAGGYVNGSVSAQVWKLEF